MTHDYLSTACHHELHEECRRTCKFCPAECQCSCHKKARSVQVDWYRTTFKEEA